MAPVPNNAHRANIKGTGKLDRRSNIKEGSRTSTGRYYISNRIFDHTIFASQFHELVYSCNSGLDLAGESGSEQSAPASQSTNGVIGHLQL